MNSTDITLSWGYGMEGHHTVANVDTGFFRSLPNSDEQFSNPMTGRPKIPRPDAVQVLSVAGTAILSSSVLAAAIKAYLASRRTKIRIAVSNNKIELEYEGPSLKDSEEEITRSLDSLIERTRAQNLQIEALRLPAEGDS